MALQTLLNWLVPKDDRFFLLLEQHAGALSEAAQIMAALVDDRVDPRRALEDIHRIEHQADDVVDAVTRALGETLVTPIDREDIHNLVTCLDSVLDYLHKATAAFVAYEVDRFTPAMRELAHLSFEAVVVLRDAMPYLRQKHLDRIAPARLKIIELEKQGDAVYQAELAALFKNRAVNAKDLLRQQAVLDALEEALDSCQDAVDVLEKAAVKQT